MGNWDISIKGTGCHHDGRPDDAEQLAAEFVDLLRSKGHHVEHAAITTGGRLDLHGDRFGMIAMLPGELSKPTPVEPGPSKIIDDEEPRAG